MEKGAGEEKQDEGEHMACGKRGKEMKLYVR